MRDYPKEAQDNQFRKYAYDFDYILRKYMIQTFKPFFTKGKALEIGCFEGETTKLYTEYFQDLTALEVVDNLIKIAKKKVPPAVKFVHSAIETAQLDPIYDSIFLIHTLEHLDNPVESLKKIQSWLSPTGRLFIAVPNADAASRQIAVKMGLIETNNSITPGEKTQGHRNTFSLDTLEHSIRQAGLKIESRGGIFFKPFANFQFDLMVQNKIIDQGYLDGCYALGMIYPELTASIYIICQRN